MQFSGPVDLGSGQIEGDVQRTAAGRPLQRTSEVYVTAMVGLAKGCGELNVVRVEGLAQIGSESNDGRESDDAVFDMDLWRLEKAN